MSRNPKDAWCEPLPNCCALLAHQPNALRVCFLKTCGERSVSSYYHAFNPYNSGWPFDAWASVWLKGHVSFGDWFSVTKDWFELSQRWPNVLFVRFEDMKADPAQTICRIAKHIGVSTNDSLIDRVVSTPAFVKMDGHCSSTTLLLSSCEICALLSI